MPRQIPLQSCDIFCRVVDNFGDIGVCWTLARALRDEGHLSVRLWVDRLDIFWHLETRIDPLAEHQQIDAIEICLWHDQHDAYRSIIPADIVIEAFACDLPEAYVANMAQVRATPIWINLEYLSAEQWVEDCHLRASPHPKWPLTKYFFFPGFTPNTGGLILDSAPPAGTSQTLWQALRLAPPDDALKISLFAYAQPRLAELLDAWSMSSQPIWCVLPEGVLLPAASHWAGQSLQRGDLIAHGGLTLHILPFLPQSDYTRLLQTCDLNFVRGEDSFVRAQWAAKPFVWHIYPQNDAAHIAKLLAFLSLYTAAWTEEHKHLFSKFWLDWNNAHNDAPSLAENWSALLPQLPEIGRQAQRWQARLQGLGSLAKNLLKFCNTLI